jgi:hypothetical protein
MKTILKLKKARQNMREDMYKVIVERPRLIHGNWLRGGRENGFRQFLQSEDRPQKIGMRAGHAARKWPNENLAPLRRFLVSNAGRPWDKVRAELLNGIDQRNTVQQHILTHVEDYVITEIVAISRSEFQPRKRGVVFRYRPRYSRNGELKPIEESFSPLFVDPRTGILRKTEFESHRAHAKREKTRLVNVERAKTERITDDGRTMRAFNGVWYEIVVAAMPGEKLSYRQRRIMSDEQRKQLTKVWDVLEKRWVDQLDADTYVTQKRQLNGKEIAKFGLRN